MGRIAFEIRNDLDPNMVDNFRNLCTNVKETGANGKPFGYKGIMADKLQQLYMVPKGHIIIINDETNGTRIYRSEFEDVENPMPPVPVNFIYLLFLSKLKRFHSLIIIFKKYSLEKVQV